MADANNPATRPGTEANRQTAPAPVEARQPSIEFGSRTHAWKISGTQLTSAMIAVPRYAAAHRKTLKPSSPGLSQLADASAGQPSGTENHH
jgi:hypothetical protein